MSREGFQVGLRSLGHRVRGRNDYGEDGGLAENLGEGLFDLRLKMGRDPVASEIGLGSHSDEEMLTRGVFGHPEKPERRYPKLELLRGEGAVGLEVSVNRTPNIGPLGIIQL